MTKEENNRMKTVEEYSIERAQQMCSTYMELYGPRKRVTLSATKEDVKGFRGMEPTITIIEEEYDENQDT